MTPYMCVCVCVCVCVRVFMHACECLSACVSYREFVLCSEFDEGLRHAVEESCAQCHVLKVMSEMKSDRIHNNQLHLTT